MAAYEANGGEARRGRTGEGEPTYALFFFLRLLFSLLRAGRLARVLGTSN